MKLEKQVEDPMEILITTPVNSQDANFNYRLIETKMNDIDTHQGMYI